MQVLPYRTIPMLARDRQIDRIGIDPLAVRSTALPDWWSFDRFRWHVIACTLEGPDDETQARPAVEAASCTPPSATAGLLLRRQVHLLDLAASGEQHGQWAGPNQAPVGWQSIETPVLDLRVRRSAASHPRPAGPRPTFCGSHARRPRVAAGPVGRR